MKRIIIFSGTTEGRRLSDMLAKEQIDHTVCVATEYGKDMMEDNSFAGVRIGRMDKEEMRDFFMPGPECLVVDATHPYATEVTDNLKEAAAQAGAEYLRILRKEAESGSSDQRDYEEISQCAVSLQETEGNILLTTGSKELAAYMESASETVRERTYVRVLPSVKSIELCESAGVKPDHILALHGPFTTQMNEAILLQYDIRHLVTKDGGQAGGFWEKMDAARNCNALLHVISRPRREEGVSVEEAFFKITGKEAVINPPVITLIGIGMGSSDGMTVEAAKAIKEADMVFGAERLLEHISCKNKRTMYRASEIIPVLEEEKPQKAVIVFSGDTGFYSGARGMKTALLEWREDCQVHILPGISSFAYLAAKLGESYETAVLFSLHGKNTDSDLSRLANLVRYEEKVFVLLSGAGDVAKIASLLATTECDVTITAASNLSYDKEEIRELSLSEAMAYEGDGILTLLIRNEKPVKRKLIPVRKDSDFIRDKVPMTKACVRHESIIRLGLEEGNLFYDIGGGTGSVAIEAAGLDESLRVVTIEKKKEAAELLEENIKKSGLSNITLLEADAAKALTTLEKPDCVFIGGSGGKLSEIIATLHQKGEGIRFVINAVSLETVGQVQAILEEYQPKDREVIMLSVTDVEQVASYHMLHAQNPVWIFSFTL